MTRRSNHAAEARLALVLAGELKARGYWNFNGLRWRSDTRVLTRRELVHLCLAWHPEAAEMDSYLGSSRFFNNLAFAGLRV